MGGKNLRQTISKRDLIVKVLKRGRTVDDAIVSCQQISRIKEQGLLYEDDDEMDDIIEEEMTDISTSTKKRNFITKKNFTKSRSQLSISSGRDSSHRRSTMLKNFSHRRSTMLNKSGRKTVLSVFGVNQFDDLLNDVLNDVARYDDFNLSQEEAQIIENLYFDEKKDASVEEKLDIVRMKLLNEKNTTKNENLLQETHQTAKLMSKRLLNTLHETISDSKIDTESVTLAGLKSVINSTHDKKFDNAKMKMIRSMSSRITLSNEAARMISPDILQSMAKKRLTGIATHLEDLMEFDDEDKSIEDHHAHGDCAHDRKSRVPEYRLRRHGGTQVFVNQLFLQKYQSIWKCKKEPTIEEAFLPELVDGELPDYYIKRTLLDIREDEDDEDKKDGLIMDIRKSCTLTNTGETLDMNGRKSIDMERKLSIGGRKSISEGILLDQGGGFQKDDFHRWKERRASFTAISEDSKSTASGECDLNLTGKGMTRRKSSIQIRPSSVQVGRVVNQLRQLRPTIRQNTKPLNKPRFSSFRNRNTKSRLSRLVCSQEDIEDDDW